MKLFILLIFFHLLYMVSPTLYKLHDQILGNTEICNKMISGKRLFNQIRYKRKSSDGLRFTMWRISGDANQQDKADMLLKQPLRAKTDSKPSPSKKNVKFVAPISVFSPIILRPFPEESYMLFLLIKEIATAKYKINVSSDNVLTISPETIIDYTQLKNEVHL